MGVNAKNVVPDDRFEFGDNWRKFLALLDEERIAAAEKSLLKVLEVDNLKGKKILDIGSGSGLFSLAARRLGAHVHSFDYDPQSVACTKELKRRFYPDDPEWTVEHGDILDRGYLKALGQYDIVYSWGVLHHTGAMWEALENVAPLVAPKGMLFIAIYNYQVFWSAFHVAMKRLYVKAPRIGKWLIAAAFILFQMTKGFVADLVTFRNPGQRYRERKKDRGMSCCYDWIDWVGGYPFEVAKPEEIFEFFRERGFNLLKLKTCGGGHGCNEYVFKRVP